MLSLHVDTSPDWQGGQRQVFDLVMGLRARGDRAVLVAHPGGELFRRMREGHDVVPLAARSDVDIAAAWALSRIIKSTRPVLVHAHDSHAVALAATALAVLGPAAGIRLVASRRAGLRLDRSSFSHWKYDHVDLFIAATGSVAASVRAAGVAESRVRVVTPGVDVDRIRHVPAANVHAEFYLPVHAPIVGSVASLVPHKGLHDLVEAARLVLREVPDARFLLIGEGQLRASLEKQIHDHHLQRHVLLVGFRRDVVELTKGVDVFVSSAVRHGGFSAVLDAMAAARAVVATNVGDASSFIVDGTSGFLVPSRQPQTLAGVVSMLLSQPDVRRTVGAAASAWVAEHFSLDDMVRATQEAYAEVVSGRLKPAPTS